MLLRRDCTWQGPLRLPFNGNADWPIVISSYGEGALPVIRDSSSNHVDISGSYMVVEQLAATTTAGSVWRDPNCRDQPVAWRTGFTLQGSAHHVTIRDSLAYGNTAGVHITRDSRHNKILRNELRDNVIMSVNSNNGGWDDSGAWGIVLNGSDNEIAYNTFSGNNAWCSYDFGQEGASIEVYEAQRNFIHHNVSINDSTFTELGSSGNRRAENNTYAYNIYISTLPVSEFLVVRGGGDNFGPTPGTRAFNNTVYLSNSDRSQGVVCHAGCSNSVLELRNNIIWAEWKALYADGPFLESNNIYWNSRGQPLTQFFGGSRMSSTSMYANPRFSDAGSRDLRLRSDSPAIDAGTDTGLALDRDALGVPLPQGARLDIGAYEFRR